jgi:NADH dehydrogenase/NADH:ubiquinone oxidoreductase subunit G
LEGRSLLCLKFLKTNLNYLLLGYNLCYRQDLNFFKNFLSFFSNSFKNVIGNFFYQGANSFGSLELGHDQHILTNQINRKNKLLYLLDMDDIFFKKDMYDSVIYQGHHGSLNIYFSDLVFAGVTPYEKNGLYINLFGMIQKSTVILKSKYKVKND